MHLGGVPTSQRTHPTQNIGPRMVHTWHGMRPKEAKSTSPTLDLLSSSGPLLLNKLWLRSGNQKLFHWIMGIATSAAKMSLSFVFLTKKQTKKPQERVRDCSSIVIGTHTTTQMAILGEVMRERVKPVCLLVAFSNGEQMPVPVRLKLPRWRSVKKMRGAAVKEYTITQKQLDWIANTSPYSHLSPRQHSNVG